MDHIKMQMDFHNELREGGFDMAWNFLYPPLSQPYTMNSLEKFEAGVMAFFSQVRNKDVLQPIYQPMLCAYAYYLGETIARNYQNATWYYSNEKGLECAEVRIKQEDGDTFSIIPFNTMYKLITGKSENLKIVVDSMDFTMKNKNYLKGIEKGVETKLPNGGYMRVLEPKKII